MLRRVFCKLLLVAIAIFSLLALSGVLFAQGRSADAFERVKEVQERHTKRLIAIQDIEGTAIGRDKNGQLVVKVFTAKRGVAGIPKTLDGVPVQVVVSGKIYALGKPSKADRPPKPPRALAATAVSESQINLDWRDNREPDLSHYNVYSSMTAGGPYDPVDSVDISSYPDTELEPGTTYYYVVTAVDTDGNESADSEEASATTEGGVVYPPAAPSNLNATAFSSSQIDLTWQDNANNEEGFKIERDSVQIAMVGANVTSYSDNGLDPSTTYTYYVCAYNSAGDSGYTGPSSATTDPEATKPTTPQNLTAVTVSSSEVDLDWNDNPVEDLVDYYNVYRSETLGGGYGWIGDTVVSNYSDTGLSPDTIYYYVVTSVNTAGESDSSNEASATTDAGPELPVDPTDWFPRPVPIGVSTGHPDITAGTIGCRVIDGDGNLYALSNNHVYAKENRAIIGDEVIQPGTIDGGELPDDYIGTLAAFVPIDFGMLGLNIVDAAIASTDEDELDNSTPVGEGGGYGTPNSETRVLTLADVGVLGVQKYGRTTGWTTGTVKDINGAFLVRYSRGFAIFYNQIVIDKYGFSDGGDSGSLIVTNDDDCNPVGLLFAGGDTITIANPIDDVLDALSVTIDGK